MRSASIAREMVTTLKTDQMEGAGQDDYILMKARIKKDYQ